MTTSDISHRKERLLFVVSAPSGSGKTSLCNEVIRQVPNLSFSISHTTRAPRHGEEHGKDYYFVSREEFRQYISQNKMAEWTEIYGNYYGTAKETIQREFDKGFDLFFDIDERGARQLSEAYLDVATILVLPPSLKALKKRLVERRTDNEETVGKRLKKAKEEIEGMAWYRYVIVNDRFEDAVSKLKSIIIAERCKDNHSLIEVLLNG
jgi:guanylate kinase